MFADGKALEETASQQRTVEAGFSIEVDYYKLLTTLNKEERAAFMLQFNNR